MSNSKKKDFNMTDCIRVKMKFTKVKLRLFLLKIGTTTYSSVISGTDNELSCATSCTVGYVSTITYNSGVNATLTIKSCCNTTNCNAVTSTSVVPSCYVGGTMTQGSNVTTFGPSIQNTVSPYNQFCTSK